MPCLCVCAFGLCARYWAADLAPLAQCNLSATLHVHSAAVLCRRLPRPARLPRDGLEGASSSQVKLRRAPLSVQERPGAAVLCHGTRVFSSTKCWQIALQKMLHRFTLLRPPRAPPLPCQPLYMHRGKVTCDFCFNSLRLNSTQNSFINKTFHEKNVAQAKGNFFCAEYLPPWLSCEKVRHLDLS